MVTCEETIAALWLIFRYLQFAKWFVLSLVFLWSLHFWCDTNFDFRNLSLKVRFNPWCQILHIVIWNALTFVLNALHICLWFFLQLWNYYLLEVYCLLCKNQKAQYCSVSLLFHTNMSVCCWLAECFTLKKVCLLKKLRSL